MIMAVHAAQTCEAKLREGAIILAEEEGNRALLAAQIT